MKRILKWGMWGILIVLLVAGAAALGAYGLLRNTVAPVSGEAVLAGLSGEVTITKDGHAIPHLEADGREDVYRALGWVHASERMWQMEVLRMAGQGRLSEMFGETTIASDRFLKTIDLATPSRSALEVIREDSRGYLRAYAEGVNAWLNRDTSSLEPALPIEFIVLGHAPDPWEDWHSALILKVMALTLDSNMDEEIGRLALAAKGFNPRQIDDIYSAGPRDEPPLLPDLRPIYGFGNKGKEDPDGVSGTDEAAVPPAEAPWQLQLPASNNWAIAGAKTESGKPLLANDPHLGLTAPSTFYLAHLAWQEDGETRNLVGGTLPGTPFVLSGRNDTLAWGLTTTYLDSQDLFIEQILSDDASRYRTAEGSLPFRSSDITIKVKGGEDVTFTRLETRNGPVLPDGYKKLKERLPNGHVAALSWTALARDDTTVDGVFDIANSATVEEFIEKSRQLVSPMQSIVIADTDGNIAITAPGRVPVRSKFNRIAGRAPVPGWIRKYRWLEYLSDGQLPREVNPPLGVVGSANSNWLPPDYDYHITYDWAEPFRQERMEQLYHSANEKQTVESMVAGQSDTLSLGLLRFRDAVLAEMPQGVRLNEAVQDALRRWDGRMEPDRPEPLILAAWHRNLLDLMLKDDLGEDFELVASGRISRVIDMLVGSGARNWCNKVDTPEIETCGDIVFEAGNLALDELRAAQGGDWSKWRWGTASTTLHEHRPFTQVGALSGFFTIRREMAGGKYTLLRNSNNFTKQEPYAGMHGSALRTVYDLSDLEKSLYMISTGQSGNVMSPHYRDLAEKWGALEYVTIPTKPESYQGEAAGVFRLTPAN